MPTESRATQICFHCRKWAGDMCAIWGQAAKVLLQLTPTLTSLIHLLSLTLLQPDWPFLLFLEHPQICSSLRVFCLHLLTLHSSQKVLPQWRHRESLIYLLQDLVSCELLILKILWPSYVQLLFSSSPAQWHPTWFFSKTHTIHRLFVFKICLVSVSLQYNISSTQR